MTEAVPVARVIRALTSDRHIRLAALDAGPLWDGVRRGHPHLEAGACAVLVEVLAGALLLQARNFFSERLQLLVRGAGRAKVVVADSWPDGDIRGMLDPAGLDQGPWVAGPGTLQVMRSSLRGEPYIGTLNLVDGPLQTQIEAYLQQSEQIHASVTLWCDPGTGEAGGLLVEPLPDCPTERLRALVHAIEGVEVVPLWERTPDFLCQWINQGPGAELLSSTEMRYACRCSRAALVEALAGFGKDRVAELFEAGDPITVHCEYCGQAYGVSRADLPGGAA